MKDPAEEQRESNPLATPSPEHESYYTFAESLLGPLISKPRPPLQATWWGYLALFLALQQNI